MLMVKQPKSTVLVVLYPEDESIMILIIVGKLLPVHRAYHLRRPEISYGYYTFNSEAWPYLYQLQITVNERLFP
jgi:hypothetical protein